MIYVDRYFNRPCEWVCVATRFKQAAINRSLKSLSDDDRAALRYWHSQGIAFWNWYYDPAPGVILATICNVSRKFEECEWLGYTLG